MVCPEIDARMNLLNEVQEMRVQTEALGEVLGLKISDSLLILRVSSRAESSSEP